MALKLLSIAPLLDMLLEELGILLLVYILFNLAYK